MDLENGKLLSKVIDENNLIVVNRTNKCFGLITRYRKTVNGVEESVIDFFIVCRRFFNLIIRMDIDEKRIYTLTKFSTKNGDKTNKESDHNLCILNINNSWTTETVEKEERIEIYNFKRKEDFENFINETNHNSELIDCFNDSNEDLNKSCDKWLSILNNIIKRCFQKIRLRKTKPNSELETLFKSKEELKTYLSLHDQDDDDL